jgi:hypothetical protein
LIVPWSEVPSFVLLELSSLDLFSDQRTTEESDQYIISFDSFIRRFSVCLVNLMGSVRLNLSKSETRYWGSPFNESPSPFPSTSALHSVLHPTSSCRPFLRVSPLLTLTFSLSLHRHPYLCVRLSSRCILCNRKWIKRLYSLNSQTTKRWWEGFRVYFL